MNKVSVGCQEFVSQQRCLCKQSGGIRIRVEKYVERTDTWGTHEEDPLGPRHSLLRSVYGGRSPKLRFPVGSLYTGYCD